MYTKQTTTYKERAIVGRHFIMRETQKGIAVVPLWNGVLFPIKWFFVEIEDGTAAAAPAPPAAAAATEEFESFWTSAEYKF